jgi:hypothetical protein
MAERQDYTVNGVRILVDPEAGLVTLRFPARPTSDQHRKALSFGFTRDRIVLALYTKKIRPGTDSAELAARALADRFEPS